MSQLNIAGQSAQFFRKFLLQECFFLPTPYYLRKTVMQSSNN